MKRNFLKRFDTQRNWPFHWGGMEIVAASILSIAILSLGSGMFGKWISAARESGILPISLHSLVEADYSVDPLTRFVPAIGLEILRDLLGISDPPESDNSLGIAILTPESPSPTPTPTVYFPGQLPTQINSTEYPTTSSTPTQRNTATATQTPTPFFTPTWTQYPTDVPVDATISPPSTTRTPRPTSTVTQSSEPSIPTPTNTNPSPTDPPITNTPAIEPTHIPTQTPTPNIEPTPAITVTSRPTHSPTLALTPTAQYTPGVTVGAPVEP